MSKQAENFKNLVKGNDMPNIITAIKMLKSSVRKELMEEYNAACINELAIKLQ